MQGLNSKMWSFQWSCCGLCFRSPFCAPWRCAVSSVGPTEMDAFASTTCAWNAAFALLGVWNPKFSIFFLLHFFYLLWIQAFLVHQRTWEPQRLFRRMGLKRRSASHVLTIVLQTLPRSWPFVKMLRCQSCQCQNFNKTTKGFSKGAMNKAWQTWFQEYGGWRKRVIAQNSGRIILKMLESFFYLLMP